MLPYPCLHTGESPVRHGKSIESYDDALTGAALTEAEAGFDAACAGVAVDPLEGGAL